MNGLPEGVVAAVVYNRVSHAKRSISVEDQNRHNHAWCAGMGLPVRAVFTDDGISASRYGGKVRTDWEKAKAELRQGDMLVTWAASRAQRDLQEFVQVRDLCARLRVPVAYSGRVLDLSRGDDRFYAGLDALQVEREAEHIAENVRRGKNTAAAAGHPATRAPWGYRMLPRNPGEPPEWEPHRVEAPRIREAVQQLLDGGTMYSVMCWVKRTDGFVPSSLTNLRRALTNPALAGLRVHQGKVVGKGTWDAIITEDQHYQLLNQLEKAPQPSRGREPKHLLTGIAKCGKCGEGVRFKKYAGKRNPGYDCYNGHCSREASAMDAAVIAKLFELIPVIAAAVPPTVVAPRTAETQRKIGELEDKLAEWREAAIAGEVTPKSFAEIEKGLLSQIAELQPKTAPKIRIPDPATMRETWDKMTVRERRDQIKTFLTITVVPAERRGARTGKLIIEPGGELGLYRIGEAP